MIKKITNDEKKIFRNAMVNVKPLQPTEKTDSVKTHEIKLKKINIKHTSKKLTKHFSETKAIFPTVSVFETECAITAETILSFSKPGLQHKHIAQLRQGKIRSEATLDLHQHTCHEAIQATDDFLKRCQNRRLRAICIIHGKGHYSVGGQPILKNLLNTYLKQHPAVLAFHSAKSNHGGAGALYVLIKVTSATMD